MNSLSLFVVRNNAFLDISKKIQLGYAIETKSSELVNSLAQTNFTNEVTGQDLSKKWYLIEDLQKILVSYFKSMYSLISKAKFKVFAEKITVQILYYITIPDANIFTWYMILNKNATFAKNNNSANANTKKIDGKSETSAQRQEYLKRKNKLINLLKKKILSAKPTSNSLTEYKIQNFELNLKSINYLYESKFNSLVRFFNCLFKKPIEFLLVRLHHSDADSNILAQLVLLVLKKKNIRRIINKLYNKKKVKDINKMKFSINRKAFVGDDNIINQKYNEILGSCVTSKMIPVFLSGLYIHIGGRLMREPIIPRKTTKKFEKGAIAVGKVNSLEETSITKKNRKGAYTIKIIFAQNLIEN